MGRDGARLRLRHAAWGHSAGRVRVDRPRAGDVAARLSSPRVRRVGAMACGARGAGGGRVVDSRAADGDARAGRHGMMARIRTAACAAAFALSIVVAHAHDGPPFPILSDHTTGPYLISIWTDPDTT